MPVGPELPPHMQKRKRSTENDDVPSSPPFKIRAAALEAPTKPRPVLGPAPPPASLDEKPQTADSDSEASVSDDDDFGPAMPSGPGSQSATEEQDGRVVAQQRQRDAEAKDAKPQREEWMLLPPSDSDWSSRVDPTKLKNRKFASGKGAKAPAEKSGVSAIWTETPEQKRQRLEDEMMGRKDASSNTQSHKSKTHAAEAEVTARRIQEYNEKNRNKSLLDEYKKSTPKEKEDDPSSRAFDKEKDMSLGRIGYTEKKDMLKKAGDFGSRFERGSFL